jgi:hypothetical protein
MASGFLLSMLSAVWRTKLCGEVGSKEGHMIICMDEEDSSLFSKVVALGCGETVALGEGLEELIGLVRMADRYQMEAVLDDLEEAVIDRLTLERCGPVLTMTCGIDRVTRLHGLSRCADGLNYNK